MASDLTFCEGEVDPADPGHLASGVGARDGRKLGFVDENKLICVEFASCGDGEFKPWREPVADAHGIDLDRLLGSSYGHPVRIDGCDYD